MQLTYDEVKNLINIDKHGVSFDLVYDFDFNTAIAVLDKRHHYNEYRYIVFGYIGLRLFVLCYTPRENTRRIISLRKANKREIKYYEKNC